MTDSDTDPADLVRQRIGSVISWEDLRGAVSRWGVVRADVARLDGQTLTGVATHWNALLHDLRTASDEAMQLAVVQYLSSPEVLQELDNAARRKRVAGEWGRGELPPVVNRQQLLILIRLALEIGKWDGTGDGLGRERILSLLLRTNDHLDGLPDPAPTDRPRDAPKTIFERVQVFPVMFALQDFSQPRRAENGVSRTMRMLGEIHPELATDARLRAEAVDLPALFARSCGIDVETFRTLCFAVVAVATAPGKKGSPHAGVPSPEDTGIFNISVKQLKGDSAIPEADVQAFLGATSRTPAEFREMLRGPYQGPEQVNFTTFRKCPVIRFESGAYRVVDKSFLLDKLGAGVYWALRDVVEREAKAEARQNAVKRLNGWWGRVFEEYAHRLIEHSDAASVYRRNPSFADGREACDGVLAYDDRAVLFEFKSSLLAAEPRHATAARLLAREILRKFCAHRGAGTGARRGARGIPQLARTAKELRSGGRIGGLRAEQFGAMYPVLVCADTAMAAPMVNGLLQRRFARLVDSQGDATVRPLTVLTIEDVETMLPWERSVAFWRMLDTWHHADPRMMTFPRLVIESRLFGADERPNAWVREGAERWREAIRKRFWPHPNNGGERS